MADTDRLGQLDEEDWNSVCKRDGCMALEKLRRHMEVEFTARGAQLDAATKGVNNFHDFQTDAIKKLSFVHGAAWAWSIILGSLLALGMYTLREIAPVIKSIMMDYYQHHPNAEYQQKSIYEGPQKVYADSQQFPQDAQVPPMRR